MRDQILQAAQEIFNRKGIQKSTLRDIARNLSISDGHLRYYYKTKEDLILAIFMELDETIAALAKEGGREVSAGIEAIIEPMTRSYEVMYRYAFFFTESTVILEMYPKVYAAYQNLIESRKAMLVAMFREYKEQGIFSREVDEDLFPILFKQFFIISDNWIRYAKMERGKSQINHYVALSVALFLPYFNPPVGLLVLQWIKKTY